MARTARLYVKLDVSFFDDDKILAAGEKAAWLYLHLLCKAKQLDTDGRLTTLQIGRLGVDAWRPRLARLIEVGLVEAEGDAIAIGKWLTWNESAADRRQRLEDERQRKADAAAKKARPEVVS
jgi:hypothetical protein